MGVLERKERLRIIKNQVMVLINNFQISMSFFVPFLTMLTSVTKWVVYVRPGLYYDLLSKMSPSSQRYSGISLVLAILHLTILTKVLSNWIFWPHE